MYTVGLIDKEERIRTFTYKTLEEAKNELKAWKKAFINNNSIKRRITRIERNTIDEIINIKEIFTLDNYDIVIMFLCKNG